MQILNAQPDNQAEMPEEAMDNLVALFDVLLEVYLNEKEKAKHQND